MKNILEDAIINYHYYEETTSTQELAKESLSRLELGEYYVISAGSQTEGIGTNNNQWISPKGNIYMSIAFIANKNQKIHLMQYVATLTVSNLLQKLAIHSNIKWPNDVLIGGKKVAGVLAQSFTNVSNLNEDTIGICLGIGLNVNCSQKEIDSYKLNATSILIENNTRQDPKELSKNLGIMLVQDLQNFLSGKATNLIESINDRLEKFDDMPITFNSSPTEEFKARIKYVNESGALVLLRGSQEEAYITGKILV
jgi:BirA family biotin operon repressor/biotin-[acetyl-CoA-carboxylase] ligase